MRKGLRGLAILALGSALAGCSQNEPLVDGYKTTPEIANILRAEAASQSFGGGDFDYVERNVTGEFISPEQRKVVAKLSRKIDTNKDHKITLSEINRYAPKLNSTMNSGFPNHRFETQNGEYQIEGGARPHFWNLVFRSFYDSDLEFRENFNNSKFGFGKELREIAKKADLNSDGMITRDEYLSR